MWAAKASGKRGRKAFSIKRGGGEEKKNFFFHGRRKYTILASGEGGKKKGGPIHIYSSEGGEKGGPASLLFCKGKFILNKEKGGEKKIARRFYPSLPWRKERGTKRTVLLPQHTGKGGKVGKVLYWLRIFLKGGKKKREKRW